MKLKMYGTRGSIATPSTTDFKTDKFGGNTSCMTITADDGSLHILDAGTGIRRLGLEITSVPPKKKNISLYLSHLHGDHIEGLPFFMPAYNKDAVIDVYAGRVQKGRKHFRKILDQRQNYRNFPVPLSGLVGLKRFYDIDEGLQIESGSILVDTCRLKHPGGCNAYKFTEGDSKVVYSTDFEPDKEGRADSLVKLIQGADVWVADGQYEIGSKKNPFMRGWGHSDPFWDAKVAIDSGVKKLIVTHHEPKMDDAHLADLELRLKEYAFNEAKRKEVSGFYVCLAREGMEINVGKKTQTNSSIGDKIYQLMK